jgi:hypothetical protein
MAIQMKKVESFPEIMRAGRQSEDLQAIVDSLHESVSTGQKFSLTVEPGNAYNSMQQRIRAQAKKFGYKIIIRYDSAAKTLYFKANRGGNVAVPTGELGTVKNKTNTSVKSK